MASVGAWEWPSFGCCSADTEVDPVDLDVFVWAPVKVSEVPGYADVSAVNYVCLGGDGMSVELMVLTSDVYRVANVCLVPSSVCESVV